MIEDDDDGDEIFQIEPKQRSSLLTRMPWWLIGTLAMLIGELSHQSFGVIVLCLKFGWNNFVTGLWLRRRDIDHVRGKVCGWFYWSKGLWQVSLSGFGCALALSIFSEFSDLAMEGITCLLVCMVSAVFADVATCVAVWSSWWHRRPVWLSSDLHECQKRNEWPPHPPTRPTNGVTGLLVLTCGLTYIVSFIWTAIEVFELAHRANAKGKQFWDTVGFVFCGLFLFIMPIVLMLLIKAIIRRVEATSPSVCWHIDYESTSNTLLPEFDQLQA